MGEDSSMRAARDKQKGHEELEFILEEIRRVAALVRPKPLRKLVFSRFSEVSHRRIRLVFGSWSSALQAAGFEVNSRGFAGRRADDQPDC
jgi:hypothetical protein